MKWNLNIKISMILNQTLEQVVRCCLEHAASVAKTFLTSGAVVVDIKELEPLPMRKPMPRTPGNPFRAI